ncbi:MAG: hypothetical protein ACX931_08690 [Saccharospirillum sp.]
MDYQSIGKTLETLGKELQKLNNKLDKVLEKLLEVETFEERKAEAVSLIEGDQIGEAINLLKVLEKDQAKAEELKQEEASLREQLEGLRLEAEQAIAGNTADGERPLKSVDAA